MLKLQQSINVGEHKDLTIFLDDDPKSNVFYYISQRPRLVVNDNGRAALSSYALLPETGTNMNNERVVEAGLSLDVDLSVSDELLDEAKKEIEKLNFGGNNPKKDKIVLSPAPVQDGLVYFVMGQAGNEPDKKWFVSSGFRPSMLGSNRASLAVRASGDQAKNLIATMSQNAMIGTLKYEMNLVGVTPVYKARLYANMQQVYHHIEEKTKKNYIFSRKEIENIVEELQSTKALDIQVEELDPTIHADAMKALFNELTNKVVEQFFTDSSLISNSTTVESVIKGVGNLVSGVLDALIPGSSYRRKEVNETQLREFVIDLNQKNAKTVPISPQGQLSEIIENAGVNIDDYIEWIDPDQLEIRGETVKVNLASDTFEKNFIAAVEVNCKVVNAETGETEADPQTMIFDRLDLVGDEKEKSKKCSQTFTYTRFRDKKYIYKYKADIHLNHDRMQYGIREDHLSTGWLEWETNFIYISIEDFFKDAEMELKTLDTSMFDKAGVSMVRAHVSLLNGEEELKSQDFELTKTKPSGKIEVFAKQDIKPMYKIDLTYYRPDKEDVNISINEFIPTKSYIIPNPFKYNWNVDLECTVDDWDKVKRVVLTADINDIAHSKPLQFTFTQDKPAGKLQTYCSTSAVEFVYTYKVYRSGGGGTYLSPQFKFRNDDYLEIIVDELKDERTVRVKLKNPEEFTAKNVKEISVKLDPPGETKKILKKDGVVEFTYPWTKKDSKSYTCSYRAKDSRGVQKASGTIQDDSDELLLEL